MQGDWLLRTLFSFGYSSNSKIGDSYIMDKKPLYVGQKCFNLDREGSLSKRLKKLSTYKPIAGYWLDLKLFPTSRVAVSVDVCTLKDDQVTLHHTKLFAAPNHLTPDPWIDNSVYVIDSLWAVWNIFVLENDKVNPGSRVFDIPEAAEFQKTPGRVNVSLRFADQQHALLADGAGRIFLLATGDRKQKVQWKVLFKEQVLKENTAFAVVDAASYINSNKQEMVDCLLVSVEEPKEESQKGKHLTIITWITFSKGADEKWSVNRTRRLEGPRPYNHVSLERGGGAVTVASNCPFTMTADSVKEVTLPAGGSGDWEMVGREPQQPLYTWSQTTEDISIQLTLPVDTFKPDVYVTLGTDEVDIGIKNSVTLLQGPLHDRIDVSTGTWKVTEQKLEISFMKEQEEMWETLVVGDTRGEMTMDEATITAIHDRLKHLTSEKWNPDPECDQTNKPYNTQQLEACDAFDDEECIYLTRVDGETHQISHQANISYNLLFNVSLDPNKPAALCLRHDVDGLLWQPEAVANLKGGAPSSECPWRHVGTLDAFGYVQASKTQRRFSTCAPDLSMAAIADCSRHVYLYRQRAPISSPLRNRRTSQDVSSVAKQHVVLLDPPDAILGLHVSNDRVFVATPSRVYAVKVAHDA
ncbi:nudC domain-containing protein 1-like isoform X2 [Littorina saxatilis]|uniref:nudC domain-containing protein 1-like isoform X2 n=1 Tax=Littorina saxatilis TaxID=31220 RepID=UPI0038B5197A